MAREAKAHLQRLGIDVDPAMECGRLPLGLQQLVELGRVLFSGARIIILDEPTSALSPPEIERLFAVLRRLKGEGTSFIFISHFLEDVLEVSDRVTVFRNSRRIATEDAAAVDKHWLIERMIGRGHRGARGGAGGRGHAQPATRPRGSSWTRPGLGRKGAFADVSLEVRAGEVLGLYGFMGSGQLELAKALMGKLVPEAGSLQLDGQPVRLTSTARAKRAGDRTGAGKPALDAVRHGAGLQEHLDQHPGADRPSAAAPGGGAAGSRRAMSTRCASGPIRSSPSCASFRAATSRRWRWRAG